jgi:FG-GAP-like repeat
MLVGLHLTGVAAGAGPGLQFDPYQAIDVGSSPAAVDVGDVTGDGLDDVVLTTNFDFDSAGDFRLWVFAQTSSGDLAAPVSYATAGGYGNWLDSGAIGDLTGDGLADVVLG